MYILQIIVILLPTAEIQLSFLIPVDWGKIFNSKMEKDKQLTFKIANERDEFIQIHQLNYMTFVDEIPQHSQNPDQMLIDKFHEENIYFICLNDLKELVGMICVRDQRPFSLDKKISNLDDLLPLKGRMCEIRLLSVKKEYRNSRVFYGLLRQLSHFCLEKGFEMALISGTSRQLKLYQHLGFKQFAEPVGTPEALFYPMYIIVENAIPMLKS